MWCSGDEEMKKRTGVGDSGGPLVQIQDGVNKLVGLESNFLILADLLDPNYVVSPIGNRLSRCRLE